MTDSQPEKKEEVPTPSPSPDQAGAESSVPPSSSPSPSLSTSTSESSTTSQEEKLQQARKFLQDAQVQNTTHERKVEFLKSKGLSESDIQSLLKEVAVPAEDSRSEASSTQSTTSDDRISLPLVKKEDRPPIVTYPEFLTKPSRPPPLVTVNRFINTIYAFSGLSALVYGASKYVVEPMVESLTDARVELHETANKDLAKLITKLESTVSEIPPPKRSRPATTTVDKTENDDAQSSYEDPTELFHRDIGVQADLPDPSSPQTQQNSQQTDKPITQQMRTLFSLVTSLKSLQDGLGRSTEALEDAQVALDGLGDDAEKLSAPAATDFVGGFSLYGAASKNEPDDEIKKAKENVRRVKGVLLSTRSFPAGR
ncbi:hypothetical protein VTJ49DRAFT_1196 [Mycothermus thermophilus]|uniref:Peroxisomal membrane protein PEX14 n=1 Tax=Humicola insolens TaxID=85995 RepID=A0ABR3VDK6_HUMIN